MYVKLGKFLFHIMLRVDVISTDTTLKNSFCFCTDKGSGSDTEFSLAVLFLFPAEFHLFSWLLNSNMMNQGGDVVKRDTGESAVTNTQLSNMQKSIESLTQSVNHFSTKQQVILFYHIFIYSFRLDIHSSLNNVGKINFTDHYQSVAAWNTETKQKQWLWL